MKERETWRRQHVADVLMCPLGGMNHQTLKGGLASPEARQGCVDCSFPGVMSSRCLGDGAPAGWP